MPKIEDHKFLKLCAELASLLGISLSSARRKVEVSLENGPRANNEERLNMVKKLLNQAKSENSKLKGKSSNTFDDLLQLSGKDIHFMVED